MLKEFKKFAMRGNVLDLAVGIIIGAAFGRIVSSLVADIVMPIIGLLFGGINLSNLQIVMRAATETTPASAITYGQFLQSVVDFLLVAFSVFLVIRVMNRFKKKEEEKPAAPRTPSHEEVLLTEIRDALRNKA